MQRSECRKAGGAGGGPRALVQPRDNPIYINRSGPLPHVGGASWPGHGSACAAGQARTPWDRVPSTPLGAYSAAGLVTGIPGPGRLECLVLLLGRQPQPAALLVTGYRTRARGRDGIAAD